MKLRTRKCGMEMKLVPYGGGWTDVYFNIGDDELYFIISSVLGDQFSELLKILYCLHPCQNDPQDEECVAYWDGICEKNVDTYKVIDIVERCEEFPAVIQEIPCKAEMEWDEEGAYSHWTFTRVPTEDEDFELQIDITVCRSEEKNYSYKVRYKDFCYAVAKACTSALKSHGIYGYHHSTYVDDINLRHLLFIKAVALDCLEKTRALKYNGQGLGESTSFKDEMNLLLFDM